MDQNELGTKRIPPLVLKMAFPLIIAQLVNGLYNIVDRIYLGHLEGAGAEVLTGVGVTYPVILLITAFSNLIGSGGGPLAAIRLGQKENRKADQILTVSATSLVALSAILMVIFYALKTPLIYAFGASEKTFIHANVEETDSGYTHSLFLIKELLFSRQTNLTQEQQKNLFIDFHIRTKKRHPGIKQKSKEYIDLMRNDPYVNALRATFGYVVTCHKAQGGEWENVYLDISRHLSRTPPRQNYQWLYTAITRAKENLHIVNDFYLM